MRRPGTLALAIPALSVIEAKLGLDLDDECCHSEWMQSNSPHIPVTVIKLSAVNVLW